MFTSATGRSLFATLLLSFATFNIRGLGHCDDSENIHSKREQLGSDCLRYGVDICAIQETKVVDRGSCRLSNGYKLVWFEQRNSRHHGLGFVISPRLVDYVVRWTCISDRVCFLDLEFPTKSGKLLRCRVVNVYGPHKKLAENNQQLLIDFYGQVRDALTVPANVETFVLGDFNSKLGKMTTSDMDFGFGRFMGKFGMGSRNEMGENLLDFLSEFDLFATNTGFCHPARHTTTYCHENDYLGEVWQLRLEDKRTIQQTLNSPANKKSTARRMDETQHHNFSSTEYLFFWEQGVNPVFTPDPSCY